MFYIYLAKWTNVMAMSGYTIGSRTVVSTNQNGKAISRARRLLEFELASVGVVSHDRAAQIVITLRLLLIIPIMSTEAFAQLMENDLST